MSHSQLAANAASIDPRTSDEAARARSLHVLLLIGSGVVAAAQIGKAIISVPMIRSELVLGLAGLIVATSATLGAMTGIGAGVVVGRLGVRRSLIGGMGAIAVGNVIGAGALIAVLALGIGGLAPGAMYAAGPHAAPGSSAVPPTIGLVQQASNIGQFAGPVALGLWVEHLGWHGAPVILAPAALFGIASAFVLGRILIIDEWRILIIDE